MFHFQIVHVEGKKNVVADALSRKPQISAVSISYHHELDDMKEQYANDEDFARIFEQLMNGQRHEHYLLKDGIYIGDGKVIHFTRGEGQEVGTGTILDNFLGSWAPPRSSRLCEECRQSRENSNGVVASCVQCFLNGRPLYRFEYGVDTATFIAKARGGTCTLAVADPVEEVLHRALYLLENGFGGYHLFHNNCEDFAMYCKTGLLLLDKNLPGRSGQAATMMLGAPMAAVLLYPASLVVGAGVYCLSRYAVDLGIRQDVVMPMDLI
ncbi:hypothetical protein L7F22_018670 [Adiantum nelumboides]|nr:hypothetical protein [Adiantum nelumboides]